MASTITTFVDGKYAYRLDPSREIVASNVLDFAVTNVAATDIVQAVKVLAGTFVKNVYLRIITAEGGTATCDVGDGVDPNGYDDSVDLDAAAGTITAGIAGTDNLVVNNIGHLYTADDTIDLIIDNAMNAGKVEIVVHGFYFPEVQV